MTALPLLLVLLVLLPVIDGQMRPAVSSLATLTILTPTNRPLDVPDTSTVLFNGTNINSGAPPLCQWRQSATVVSTANATDYRSDGGLCPLPVSADRNTNIFVLYLSIDAGTSYSLSSLSFRFTPVLALSVDDTVYDSKGGSVMTLRGGPYQQSLSSSLLCRVNNSAVVAATYASTTAALCTVPASNSTDDYVSVSVVMSDNGGYDWSTASTAIIYAPTIDLVSINPALVPNVTSTPIVVSLSLTPSLVYPIYCLIGDSVVLGYDVDNVANSLTCIVPPAEMAGDHGVSLSYDRQVWYGASINVTVYLQPVILALSPPLGLVTGSTTINVTLYNPTQATVALCRFDGSVTVAPLSQSSNWVACVSPDWSATMPGTDTYAIVTLDITVNSFDWTLPSPYEFLREATVTQAFPSALNGNAGQLVYVNGGNFISSASLVCIVDEGSASQMTIDALFVSVEQIICPLPTITTLSMASVSLTVTNNLALLPYQRNGVLVLTLTHATLVSLSPPNVLTTYQTLFYALGLGFDSGCHCVMDGRWLNTVYINSTALQCQSPLTSIAITASVRVVDSYGNYTQAQSLTFAEGVELDTVSPDTVTYTGGTTLTLSLVSAGIITILPSTICQFVVSAQTFYTILVTHSSTVVTCLSPDLSGSGLSFPITGSLALQSSNETLLLGLASINTLALTFREPSEVYSVSPDIGPIDTNTSTIIHGWNFIENYRYVFSINGQFDIVAQWLSSMELLLVMPSTSFLPSLGSAVSMVVTIDAVADNGLTVLPFGSLPFTLTAVASYVIANTNNVNSHGGALVVLTMSGAVYNSPTLRCLFDTMVVTAVLVTSTDIQCVAPPHITSNPYSVNLSISVNAIDWQYATDIVYTMPMLSDSAGPLNGPTSGGTVISMTGLFDFVTGVPITARYGGTVIGATVCTANLAKTQLQCSTPALTSGSWTIELTNNGGVEWYATPFSFVSEPIMTVTNIDPNNGPLSGGTIIALTGTSFPASLEAVIVCRFDSSVVVPAITISDTFIQCQSPAQTFTGPVLVEVSSNGQQFVSAAQSFDYDTIVSASSLSISGGPVTGGTVLTITGSGFVSGPGLACRFDGITIITATYVSATIIQCLTPYRIEPPSTSVSVSNNRQDWVSVGAFTYYESPMLTMAEPRSVPVSTTTVITITGIGFTANVSAIVCRLSLADGTMLLTVTGSIIDDSAVTCPLTSNSVSASGSVTVSVSLNDGYNWHQLGQSLTFFAQPFITAVSPALSIIDMVTPVTVTGTNIIDDTGIVCFIGGTIIVGHFVNGSAVVCMVPPLIGTISVGLSSLALSLDGGLTQSNVLPFSIIGSVSVISFNPVIVLDTGGNNLTLILTTVTAALRLRCHYQMSPLSSHAIIVDSTTVICVTPPMIAGPNTVTVISDASPNLVLSQSFTVIASLYVTDVSPVIGRSDGGTELTITGRNFASPITCIFTVGAETVVVTGTVVSLSLATCTSPTMTSVPGSVSLRLVNVDGSVTDNDHTVNYASNPSVTSVWPAVIPYTGDTIITITGTSFVNADTLSCHFSDSGLGIEFVVAGYFQSSTVMTCVSPDLLLLLTGDTAIGLSVSLNSQDWFGSATDVDYRSNIAVDDLSLTLLADSGDTITLTGLGFLSFPSNTGLLLQCHFHFTDSSSGSAIVRATAVSVVSDNVMECSVPNTPVPVTGLGPILTAVTVTDGLFSSAAIIVVELLPVSIIASAAPVSVSQYEMLTIAGEQFQPLSVCRYQSSTANIANIAVTTATVISDTVVQCPIPMSLTPTNGQASPYLVSVAPQLLSVNSNTLTPSVLPFVLTLPPSIDSVTMIENGSGVVLTVSNTDGSYVDSDMFACRVDGVTVSGSVVNASVVQCLVGGGSVAPASVSVSNNGHYYSAVTALTPIVRPTALSIWPSDIYVSLSQSQSLTLTITGNDFVDSASLSVRIGDAIIMGDYVSDNVIECPLDGESLAWLWHTGSVSDSHSVSISVSNDGRYYSDDGTTVTLHASPIITALEPRYVQPQYTSAITVTGAGFTTNSQCVYQCHTGVTVNAIATVCDQHNLLCSVPLTLPVTCTEATLAIANADGSDWQWMTPLSTATIIIMNTALSSLSPSLAPLTTSALSLTITGMGFPSLPATVHCEYNGDDPVAAVQTVASVIDTGTITCPLSVITSTGVISVRVLVDDRVASNELDVTMTAPLRLLSLAPVSVSVIGNTPVIVTTDGSLASILSLSTSTIAFQCVFDSSVSVTAAVVDTSHLECVTPTNYQSLAPLTTSTLSVVSSDRVYRSNELSLSLMQIAYVNSLAPIFGPMTGGTIITITGRGMLGLGTGQHCLFDGTDTTAITIVSDTVVQCPTPAITATSSAVIVSVSLTAGSYSDVSAGTFTYLPLPAIGTVAPLTVLLGTSLTVTGSGFVGTSTLACRYDSSMVVSAVYYSTTMVYCPVPSMPSLESLPLMTVEVTNDGNSWALSGTSVTVIGVLPNLVTAMTIAYPLIGPMLGGTSVTVFGDGFVNSASLSCHWGSAVTVATYLNTTSLKCQSPPQSAGLSLFSVSNDGVNAYPSSPYMFQYVDSPVISTVGSLIDTVSGSTIITITGTNLASGYDCVFVPPAAGAWPHYYPASLPSLTQSWRSSITVDALGYHCPAPPLALYTASFYSSVTDLAGLLGVVLSVGVSVNSIDGASQLLPIILDSFTAMSITSVSRNVRPDAASDWQVDLYGTNLSPSTRLQCLLGSSSSLPLPLTVYHSPSHVECLLPSTLSLTPTTLTPQFGLSLPSLTPVYSTATAAFTMEPPVIDYVIPSTLTLGSVVSVILGTQAASFPSINSNPPVTCVVQSQYWIQATVINNSAISCVLNTQLLGLGNTSVAIITDGLALSLPVTVTVVPPAHSTMLSLARPYIVSVNGGDSLTITGTGFTDLTQCRFEFHELDNAPASVATVFASYVSNTVIVCVAPPAPMLIPQRALLFPVNDGPSVSGRLGFDTHVSVDYVSPATVTRLAPVYGPVGVSLIPVAVTGTGFLSSPSFLCAQQSLADATRITVSKPVYQSPLIVTCLVGCGGGSGSWKIGVSNNYNGSYAWDSAAFYCVSVPVIASISPTVIDRALGAVITITGTNLTSTVPALGTSCIVNGNMSISVLSSSSAVITCILPAQSSTGTSSVSVSVSVGGTVRALPWTSLLYVETPRLVTLSPPYAVIGSSVAITITGAAFLPSMILYANIVPIAPTVLSSTTLTVTLPSPASASVTSFTCVVNVNDTINVRDTLSFQWIAVPTITALNPSAVSSIGLTSLTVSGTGFPLDVSQCWYNATSGTMIAAQARHVNGTTIDCAVPALPPASYTVTLSFVSGLTVASTTTLSVYAAAALTTLSLTSPVITGSLLSINATRTLDTRLRLACQFYSGAGTIVETASVSAGYVNCTLPMTVTDALTSLAIVDTQGNTVYQSPLTFATAATVSNMASMAASITGGATLAITGTKLSNQPLACVFTGARRTSQSSITASSTSRATCSTPVWASAELVTLKVVALSSTPVTVIYQMPFAFINPIAITAINPTVVPASSTMTLTISGTNFTGHASGDLACTFTGIGSSLATVHNSTLMTCQFPLFTGTVSAGMLGTLDASAPATAVANVSVSVQSVSWAANYTSLVSLPIIVVRLPAILALQPSTVPAFLVFNLSLVVQDATVGLALLCVVNERITVSAAVTNGTTIVCADVPSLAPGQYSVRVVTTDDQSQSLPIIVSGLSLPALTLIVTAVPQPVEAHPHRIANNGKDWVTLTLALPLSSISHSLSCRWNGTAILTGMIVDTSTVNCPSPSLPSVTVTTLEVAVDGGPYRMVPVPITLAPPVTLVSVTPSLGVNSIDSPVFFTGSSFPPSSLLRCQRSRTSSTVALSLDSQSALCQPFEWNDPPSSTSTDSEAVGLGRLTNLALTMDGSVIASVNVTVSQFMLAPSMGASVTDPAIIDISPVVVNVNGGDTITITLNRFNASIVPISAKCLFGPLIPPVSATLVNASAFACVSPGIPSPMVANFALSLNGGYDTVGNASDSSQSYFALSFVSSPVVEKIFPRLGTIGGGTLVTIIGHEFPATMTCQFDGILSAYASVLSSTVAVCQSPAYPSAASVKLQVSGNDMLFEPVSDGSMDWRWYQYIAPIVPLAIDVNTGPSLGGNTVIVTVNDTIANYDTDQLQCQFGSVVSPMIGRVLDAYRLACVVPSEAVGSVVPVSVAVNGHDFLPSPTHSVDYTYARDTTITVTGISPSIVPFGQSTVLTVTGAGFAVLPSPLCLFNGLTITTATVVSDNVAECPSPYGIGQSSMIVEVQSMVPWNYEPLRSITSATLSFVSPAMLSVTPSIVDGGGATIITISGTGFSLLTPAVSCSIQSISVVPISINDSAIVCVAPSATTLGVSLVSSYPVIVPLSLAWSNNSFTTLQALPLSYVTVPSLTSLWPIIGYSTLVSFRGTGFLPSSAFLCRFGSLAVMAFYQSSTDGFCVSPRQPPATVDFAVSVNGQQWSNNFTYQYIFDMTVTAVSPTITPLSGGTLLTIHGLHFINTSDLACRFGSSIALVPATYLNDTVIQCQAPAAQSLGVVSVTVTPDGVNFTDATGAALAYVAPSLVTGLIPLQGFANVPTLVTITGRNFILDSDVRCVFGSVIVTPTAIQSTTMMQCVALPQPPGAVLVSIQPNNYIAPVLMFQYLPQPLLLSVTPDYASQGNIDRAGPVYIAAANLTDAVASELLCDFGVAGTAAIDRIRNDTIICQAPLSLQPVTVNLSLVLAREPYTMISVNSLLFTFVTDLTIIAFQPMVAPLRTNTSITIQGSGYLNTTLLTCRFGSTLTVLADYLSSESLRCLLPSHALYDWPIGALTVTVEVSNNAIDFARATTLFRYLTIDDCVSGTVCPPYVPSMGLIGLVYDCPAGSYCLGVDHSELCPVGYYQPYTGLSFCLSCPIGFYCPDRGMQWPLLCPAGFVCGSDNLVNPFVVPCTAGHQCQMGTVVADSNVSLTSDTDASAMLLQRKQPTFLRRLLSFDDLTITNLTLLQSSISALQLSGDASDVSELISLALSNGSILTTATDCPAGYYCLPGSTSLAIVSVASVIRVPLAALPCYGGRFCPSLSASPLGASNCPRSYYCPAPNIALLCPAGSYCPGGNDLPLLCPPSTFGNVSGLSECYTCLIGYMCPKSGMTAPQMCVAGVVCDRKGLITPLSLCPPGHWCEPGTPFTALPHLCSASYFCLDGVSSNVSQPWNFSTPQVCVAGSYCLTGASSVFGTALCPAGAFCPTGMSTYTEAATGEYVDYSGSPIDYQCLPGTFSPTVGSVHCSECPAGFSCAFVGAKNALICPKGFYRSMADTVLCVACPRGTFNSEQGLSDSALCQPCLPGYVCGDEGLTGMNGATQCVEGYVCGEGTTPAGQYDSPCPKGFVCGQGTIPATQYDSLCPSGYTCSGGVAASESRRSACRKGYYCPPGVYNALPTGYMLAIQCTVNQSSTVIDDFICGNSTVSIDLPYGYRYTRQVGQCPLGTTSLIQATHLSDCYVDPVWDNYPDPVWEFSPLDLAAIPETPSTFVQTSDSYCPYGSVCADTNNTLNTIGSLYRSSQLIALHVQQMDYVIVTLAWANLSTNLTYNEQFELLVYVETLNPTEPIPLPISLTSTQVSQHAVLELAFMCLVNTTLTISVGILHGRYLSQATEFVNTGSVRVIEPSRANTGTRDIFMTVYDFSGRSLFQPLNLPSLINDAEMLFSYQFQSVTMDPRVELIASSKEINSEDISSFMANNGLSVFAFPFLPFFSNCRGYDSYINIYVALQDNSSCVLVPENEVVAVGNFDFLATPNSDTCNIETTCLFEENMNEVTTYPRWFDKSADQNTMFYIAATPFDSTLFDTLPVNGYIDIANYYSDALGSDTLVGVIVNRDQNAASNAFPRLVQLDIQYQQTDTVSKKIITAAVTLSEFSTDLTERNYTLVITYTPLTYFGLVNQFVFNETIFELIYLAIGVISVIAIAVLWLMHRTFTPLHFPPQFRLLSYYRVMFPPAIYAFLAWAGLPCALFYFLYYYFVIAAVPLLSEYSGNVATDLGNVSFDTSQIPFYAAGRIGACVLAFSLYSMWAGARMFIPERRRVKSKKEGEKESEVIVEDEEMDAEMLGSGDIAGNVGFFGLFWTPKTWKRTNFLLVCVVLDLSMLCVIEFSYSGLFNQNQWAVIFLFKAAEIPIGFLLAEFLQEGLLTLPCQVLVDVVQSIITIGAPNFVQFILGFFVQDVALKYIERVWRDEVIEETIEKLKSLVKKWERFTLSRAEIEAEQKLKEETQANGGGESQGKGSDSDEEVIAPVLNSHELSDEILGPIIEKYSDYSVKVISLILLPVLMSFLYVFRDATQMTIGWGIAQHDMFFYLLFIVTLLPFMSLLDVLIMNIQELFHFWKLFDYLQYLDFRFRHRAEWWQMTGWFQAMDQALPRFWRSVDYLCFSSQYYFMLIVHTGGMIFFIFALEIFIHNQYNPFNDLIGIGIFVATWVLCEVVERVSLSMAHMFGLWPLQPVRSRLYLEQVHRQDTGIIPSWENDYARQIEELHASQWFSERGMTSYPFKRRFLALNKDWIIEQIRQWVELSGESQRSTKPPQWLTAYESAAGRQALIRHVANTLGLVEFIGLADELLAPDRERDRQLKTHRKHRHSHRTHRHNDNDDDYDSRSLQNHRPKRNAKQLREDRIAANHRKMLVALTYKMLIDSWPSRCLLCNNSHTPADTDGGSGSCVDTIIVDRDFQSLIDEFYTLRVQSGATNTLAAAATATDSNDNEALYLYSAVSINSWTAFLHARLGRKGLCQQCQSQYQLADNEHAIDRMEAIQRASAAAGNDGDSDSNDSSARHSNVSISDDSDGEGGAVWHPPRGAKKHGRTISFFDEVHGEISSDTDSASGRNEGQAIVEVSSDSASEHRYDQHPRTLTGLGVVDVSSDSEPEAAENDVLSATAVLQGTNNDLILPLPPVSPAIADDSRSNPISRLVSRLSSNGTPRMTRADRGLAKLTADVSSDSDDERPPPQSDSNASNVGNISSDSDDDRLTSPQPSLPPLPVTPDAAVAVSSDSEDEPEIPLPLTHDVTPTALSVSSDSDDDITARNNDDLQLILPLSDSFAPVIPPVSVSSDSDSDGENDPPSQPAVSVPMIDSSRPPVSNVSSDCDEDDAKSDSVAPPSFIGTRLPRLAMPGVADNVSSDSDTETNTGEEQRTDTDGAAPAVNTRYVLFQPPSPETVQKLREQKAVAQLPKASSIVAVTPTVKPSTAQVYKNRMISPLAKRK